MKYGVAKAGVRVMNATKKQEPSYIEVRCTVCGKIYNVKPGEVK